MRWQKYKFFDKKINYKKSDKRDVAEKYYHINKVKNWNELKKERKEEVIKYMKIMPYDEFLMKRIQQGWENKILV